MSRAESAKTAGTVSHGAMSQETAVSEVLRDPENDRFGIVSDRGGDGVSGCAGPSFPLSVSQRAAIVDELGVSMKGDESHFQKGER